VLGGDRLEVRSRATFDKVGAKWRGVPSELEVSCAVPGAHAANFTRAADELCVTQGAVSHQVKALEAELGLKLFNRERQGLAYSIYSDLNPYRDTGCMAVYAGTSLSSANKVVKAVVNEFRDLKTKPVPEEELRRSKDQLKGSLMLSLESSTARMSNLARQEMYFDHFQDLDELIEKISNIPDQNGKPIGTKVYKPQSIYRVSNAIPPDLIVIFGKLYWRSVGSLGLNTIHTFENDTGPDDANHAQYGMYIYYDPKRNLGGC